MAKNLILSAVSDYSLHPNWIADNPNFDLFLIYYGDIPNKFEKDAKYYVSRKGNKFLMFYDIINYKEDIFRQYDRILILDDDLYTETSHLNNFFKIFEENDFYLAQPSVIGWYSHEINLHDPKWIWRCTNYVEIMCPCFNQESLFKCKETFIESDCGWGIDWVWSKLLGWPKDKIAVIDEAIVFHTRPIKQGDFYKNNNLENTDHFKQMKITLDKYEITPRYEVYYENSRWKNINAKAPEERIYPHFDRFKKLLQEIRNPAKIPMI